jgi:hypothetical protein
MSLLRRSVHIICYDTRGSALTLPESRMFDYENLFKQRQNGGKTVLQTVRRILRRNPFLGRIGDTTS